MSRIQRWNGNQWVEVSGLFQRWNGNSFEDATVRRWNGSSWEIISQREYTTTYRATWTGSYNGSGAYSTRVRTAVWGDTLSHYAVWYNTTVSQLTAWNQPFIRNPHRIYAGDRYTIARNPMGRRRNTNNIMYVGERSVNRLQNNHGRQSGMIGFNDAQIRSDLSGAEILRCEVFVRCHSAHGNNVRAVFGYHNQSNVPGSFSETQYWAQSDTFTPGQGKWVQIPNSLGQRLRDGTARGVTLHANSSSNAYVGSFQGRGNNSPPQLRITYRK